MRLKTTATLLLALIHFVAKAQQNTDSIIIKKIADDILTKNAAYENLRILCKKIGPRLSGSPQAEKAATTRGTTS